MADRPEGARRVAAGPAGPRRPVLRVALITLGDPGTMTGGYLYHRRMAVLAPEFGAAVSFVSFPQQAFPLPARSGGSILAAAARTRPHVLLLDSIAAGYLAPWLGRVRLPAPLAAILHQPPGGIDAARWRVGLQARLDRYAYRRARLVVAASAALAAEVRAHLPGQPVVVVAPGRDAGAAAGAETPDSVQSPDLRRGRRAALLCVGNWIERKGVLDLLDALARLPADAATLHLVGDADADPRYAACVRARLARPDLAGRVVVHGAVPAAAVSRFYPAADVFVLASTREPYGTVYGEAMAAGLPVVGWAAGNLPHLARDGCEGLVIPPGDQAALSAALHRLCLDEALRRRLGAAARRRALTFPTWRDSAARLFGWLRTTADV